MSGTIDHHLDQTTDTLVRVASLTGPSYGGHGPLAGQLVHVLRLGMCNLACEWCDHPETVAALGADLDTTAPYTTVSALADRITEHMGTDRLLALLITGGEPLVQDYALHALLASPELRPLTTVVETNGTKPPPDWWGEGSPVDRTELVSYTIVSPKVGTHDPQHKRLPDKPLRQWADLARMYLRATFHFTVQDRSDVEHAARLCDTLDLSPSDCCLTPEGRGHDTQLTALAAILTPAAEYGFRISTRPRQLILEPIEVHRR